MSSKTPNDILKRITPHTISKNETNHKKTTSTRLKDVFINSKEREELMTACSKGDLPKVTYLLEQKKAGLNPDLIRDSKLRTPLLVACAAGQAAVVRQLVRWGADVNNPTGDIIGNKPLDLAVISNDVDTVLALLEAGAKIRNHAGSTDMQTRLRAATRTPLDLANSRLDLLIHQSKSTGSVNQATMDQVLKIIELLKHFLPNDTVQLDELTSQLSSIDIDKKQDQDVFIMQSLKDVISKIKIE
ncbi:ankyrin repeat-containing domain protein [Gilbertella persicaria]|uniref:ankyrin repeat-containing domain protein n=1 Tax=Gilbertella persicaria TaxID=101096 RepID=UPI00221F1217|nr:ankyrin repeat-containing domain protein [Gilbertella persicaria]KAI8092382.1 ankyrin repeat-containing domain protein [Gilbertella persicaria]